MTIGAGRSSRPVQDEVDRLVGLALGRTDTLPLALPGLWRHGQRILDGAMVANVPAGIVRSHGAHCVISVSVVAPRQGGLGGHRVLSAAYDLTVRRFTDEGAACRRLRADIEVQVEGDLKDRPPRSVAAPGPTAGR